MKFRKTLLIFVFVFILTFAVWHRVLGQALLGEGGLYFEERSGSLLEKHGFFGIALRYDTQAIFFFHFLGDVIRDKLSIYMLILLITLVLINFSIYLVVSKVTRKPLVGIIAAVLLTGNYVGSAEFFTSQYYVQFIQRVPNLIPTLIGFLFLVNFYKTRKERDYWISLSLFSTALFFSHNTFMLAPLFFLYPLLSSFTTKSFIRTIPFYVISYLLVGLQSFPSSEHSLLDFLKMRPGIVQDILDKLTISTIPSDVLLWLFSLIGKSNFASTFNFYSTFLEFVRAVSIPVALTYAVLTFWIARDEKSLRGFILTLSFSIPTILFLSIYIKPSFVNELGSSRHLYVAGILIAMFWSVVLYKLSGFGKRAKLVVITFMTIWFFYNNHLIQKDFDAWQERHKTVVATFNYVSRNHSKFPDNSIVLMHPWVGYYNAKMLESFYGERGIRFSYRGMPTEELTRLSKGQYVTIIYLAYYGNMIKEEPVTDLKDFD